MLAHKSAPVLMGSILALSLLTSACATKKHVREAIAPVQNQVNDLSKKHDDFSKKTDQSIGDLDRNVAKVDEKAMEADRKAGAAGEAAKQANSAAGQAQQTANGANSLAQQSMAKTVALESAVANLDNFKLATTEKIYFRTGKAEITKDELSKLDRVMDKTSNAKNYVIEVEGFTDKTGSKTLNLELSRRRAEAVVRYLTVEKSVPLRKIHDVGVGAEFPNAVNKTKEDRKENRRVDVKVFVLDAATQMLLQRDASVSFIAPTCVTGEGTVSCLCPSCRLELPQNFPTHNLRPFGQALGRR